MAAPAPVQPLVGRVVRNWDYRPVMPVNAVIVARNNKRANSTAKIAGQLASPRGSFRRRRSRSRHALLSAATTPAPLTQGHDGRHDPSPSQDPRHSPNVNAKNVKLQLNRKLSTFPRGI